MAEPQPETPKKIFGHYSIFWALAVLMALLGIVPLFLYSQKAIRTSREYIEESLRERQLLTANPAADHVRDMVALYADHLDNLAAIFQVSSADPDVRAAHENLLSGGLLEKYVSDACLLVLYADDRGNRLSATSPRLAGGDADSLLSTASANLQKLSPDQAQPLDCDVFYTKLTSNSGMTTPAFMRTVPIRRGDATVATVSGIFSLDRVQNSLAQYGRELTLYVTDGSGRLILHADPSYAGRSTDLSQDPVVARITGSGLFPNSPTNTSVSTTEGGRTKTYLVTYTPLVVLDYRWILYAQADRENYLALSRELGRQSTFWIAALILVSLLACFFTARLITKPILDMTEISKRVADGDFSMKANEGVRNEVGDLARSFNKMATEIQKYIREVEAKADENKRLFINSIRAIANAIDAKDPYTRGHSERVSAYSLIVAREYGLNETQLGVMQVASLLHDVGKIGIEDRILRKPGALTNDEFDVMKTHPPKGADILTSIPEMAQMIPGVRHHHERWGGGGYPDGLKGEQIPLLARIVGVADAFDAMTTNRPYQRAMTFPMAANRVNELVNTVYDPRVVEAFNRAYQKGAFLSYQQRIQGAATVV